MIASSSTVLSNLAYLIGAVVVAVIGGLLVWLRHRQPKSVDANMASFRRGLSALAPDPRSSPGATIRRSEQSRLRPAPIGLTHVKIEPSAGAPAGEEKELADLDRDPAAGQAGEPLAGEWAGGHPG